jgi:CRP/FNR family transcriptional activator FtrB
MPFEKRLLASLLGMTPENLSRSFAALGADVVASDSRSIVIKDRERLLQIAQPTPLIEELHDPQDT